MLPDRIELSTSPLPMECSTTELRQHAPDTESAQKSPAERADPCHKPPACASAGGGWLARKNTEIGAESPWRASMGRLRADLVADSSRKCCGPGPSLSVHGVVLRFFVQAPEGGLKVAAAAVIGLLLVRTFPGPTGSR